MLLLIVKDVWLGYLISILQNCLMILHRKLRLCHAVLLAHITHDCGYTDICFAPWCFHYGQFSSIVFQVFFDDHICLLTINSNFKFSMCSLL